MLSCFLELPVLLQTALVVSSLLGALKIYLIVTLGVCNSKNKLNGKTVIITGANTGIGKETAIDLARRGAKVILACRDLKKAAAAKDDIITESGNKNVHVRHLDLASLASVRKFAAEINKSEPRLDVLINNAGCATTEKKLTEDGLEYQMQSNHFGHFLLTNLLLGKNVTVNALHPGVVHTEFGRFMPLPAALKRIAEILSLFFSKTSIEGAQTTIHLAVADEVANVTGEYFSDCKITKTSKLATDIGLAKKLWEVSEAMVKLNPEERHF